jgi:hypothetical protein
VVTRPLGSVIEMGWPWVLYAVMLVTWPRASVIVATLPRLPRSRSSSWEVEQLLAVRTTWIQDTPS